MVSAESSRAPHADGDPVEEIPYRSISTLAVVAFVLGLLSASALTAPLLLVVPLAACCVALAAIASIHRAADRLAGMRLAAAGLVLAIVCGVGAVVRVEIRAFLLERQAIAAVEAWVGLLAEQEWEGAIARLSGRGQSTLQPPSSPGQPPLPLAEARQFMKDELKSAPLAERLAQFDAPLQIRLLKPLSAPIFRGRNVTLQHLYEVWPGEARDQSFRMTVQLTRMPAFEADGLSLRIDDWAIEPATTP